MIANNKTFLLNNLDLREKEKLLKYCVNYEDIKIKCSNYFHRIDPVWGGE